MFKVAVFNLQ